MDPQNGDRDPGDEQKCPCAREGDTGRELEEILHRIDEDRREEVKHLLEVIRKLRDERTRRGKEGF